MRTLFTDANLELVDSQFLDSQDQRERENLKYNNKLLLITI